MISVSFCLSLCQVVLSALFHWYVCLRTYHHFRYRFQLPLAPLAKSLERSLRRVNRTSQFTIDKQHTVVDCHLKFTFSRHSISVISLTDVDCPFVQVNVVHWRALTLLQSSRKWLLAISFSQIYIAWLAAFIKCCNLSILFSFQVKTSATG